MISVVVPIYNSEDTITDCIKSILLQSFRDFEIILVDDGCTDRSGLLCDVFSEKYDCITVVHQQNKGRVEARKIGVEKAIGEWICFVDSDDTLPVNSLELLHNATTDNTDIVLGNGYTLFPETRKTIPISDFRHMTVRGDGTIGVPWGSLYKRSVITPYLFDIPRHIYNGEDYLYWLRLVFLTEKPVNVVYDSVYNKGEEHTSNRFVWTADYCYELNELRKKSIPTDLLNIYLPDMLKDRLVNLFAVAVCQSKKEWKKSKFYKDIINDMKVINCSFNIKQKCFLFIPSLWLRKYISHRKNN